jgi:hypothetical protein
MPRPPPKVHPIQPLRSQIAVPGSALVTSELITSLAISIEALNRRINHRSWLPKCVKRFLPIILQRYLSSTNPPVAHWLKKLNRPPGARRSIGTAVRPPPTDLVTAGVPKSRESVYDNVETAFR